MRICGCVGDWTGVKINGEQDEAKEKILMIDSTVHMWAGTAYTAVASRTRRRMETWISDQVIAAHNAATTPHVLCATAAVKFQVA